MFKRINPTFLLFIIFILYLIFTPFFSQAQFNFRGKLSINPNTSLTYNLCSNGIKDKYEENIDCGGNCMPCCQTKAFSLSKKFIKIDCKTTVSIQPKVDRPTLIPSSSITTSQYQCPEGKIRIQNNDGSYTCHTNTKTNQDLCKSCESGQAPDGYYCWDINGQKDVSHCASAYQAIHIVCSDNGNVSATELDCDDGFKCLGGFCRYDADEINNNSALPPGVTITYSNEPLDTSLPPVGDTDTAETTDTNSTTSPNPPEENEGCTDPDGDSTTEQTSVIGINPYTDELITLTDKCTTVQTVQEAICLTNEYIGAKIINCANDQHCENGHCIDEPPTQLPCEDPDESSTSTRTASHGLNPYTGFAERQTDYCENTETVIEAICSPEGNLSRVSIDCAADQHCNSGRCIDGPVPVIPCTDPDGASISTKTIARGSTQIGGMQTTRSDYCRDSNTVNEAICNADGFLKHISINCNDNEFCENGQCIEIQIELSCNCSEYNGVVIDSQCREHPNLCDGNTAIEYECSPRGEFQIKNKNRCPTSCHAGFCN
ncbi:hypothetical protein BVY03_04440 [bacterium K02(2017)]|nr:hypothetical protein BVY03_04440 [bacterium K02(2017)]